VHFFGRDDDVITSAGFRIGPGEIEDCLTGHPAIALAAAVGKPDAMRTEIVKAYVVLKDGTAASEALAEEIKLWVRERLSAEPVRLGERSFTVTASFGVVSMPAASEQDAHELLSLADSACFFAKERGRNRVHVYGADDTGVARRREEMDWISRISDALLENRFRLYCQQIHPVEGDSEVRHCEILLRMVDVNGNIVPPAVFIPPAERYNLMPRIDRWMLESVFTRLGGIGRDRQVHSLIALNLSGSTLSDEGLTEFIVNLFETHDVAPQSVCFEITETAAIANFDDAMRFIGTVRELGCRVALDDFGSGLSSFRYLKEIRPDFLKIDGSFVREITHNSTDHSMVEAINRVGKTIGIRTVAEFVEDEATLQALRRIGVDLAQGYGLHRPEPW
jgi:EAL domain-containing protein (putative c-di-GMP-specific phosphodiesterase class I)